MFTVKKNESSNKTVRMSNDLIKKLEKIARDNNVSFNKIVVQCCEYAMENMEKKDLE